MRHAIVADKFYPADKHELERQMDRFFSSLEVASLKDREIRAAIVPHAGYAFSGKCASFAYQLLKNRNFPSFIILGTNHSGLGSKFSLSVDDFDNSLGVVESDIELIEEIMLKSVREKLDLSVDENSQRYEHSIEVQMPFLQATQKKFKIVSILVRDLVLDDIKKFGKILAEILKTRNAFLLVSSDFTHYGSSYGFVPFKDNVRENLYKLDEGIIDRILNLDLDGFIQATRRSTVCGKDAVSCCIEASRILKLKAEKLCYYTSGDVLDEWDSAVGYASIVFS